MDADEDMYNYLMAPGILPGASEGHGRLVRAGSGWSIHKPNIPFRP